MAKFSDLKYEMNQGTIILIRLGTDEAAQAGTPPAGALDLGFHAYQSVSRRRFGVQARGVSLKREVGTGADTANKYTFLPVLTPAEFATPAYAEGATITIGTTAWTVVDQIPEKLR